MAHELNFVDPRIGVADIHLFLGPIDESDGPFMAIESGWTMAHVMHAAGAFPSVKQAKNNGWNRPISPGYDEFTVGKRHMRIFTLTPFD